MEKLKLILREIQDRYSVRNFSDKQISDEILKEILEAARLAPSWTNTQPWHFIVVKNEQNKALLCQLSHGQPHVEKAPIIIVCCGDKNAWETENLKKTIQSKPGITEKTVNILLKNPALNPSLISNQAVMLRTIEELTYAIAYMTIEATYHGLGSCVIGAIGNELTDSVPEVYELTKKTLDLPENLTIMTLLILGYPDETFKIPTKIRKPFSEIVSYEFYGRK